MKEFIGKNTDFVVIWNCNLQHYSVYYKNEILCHPKYKFSDVKSYLN